MSATQLSSKKRIEKMWCVRVCVCVCVYPHIHTMEYYSAIKKKETLPLATAYMDLESITLTEITQRKINAS